MSSPEARNALLSRLPHVWRLEDLAREEATLASGHAPLDACLPGGGWPLGHLVELLQERPEAHVWQLVLPALAQALGRRPGPVVLVGAPQLPFVPALAAQGLEASRLLRVQAERPHALGWAAEQALRCADVVAVLAWLPQARPADLRRLQVAAQQQRQQLLFVMRGVQVRQAASPARLRLLLQAQGDTLQVHLLKRRGPPLDAPVPLPAWPVRVQALLAARRRHAGVLPVSPARRSHGLDRPVAIG
jgi:protein ImuA